MHSRKIESNEIIELNGWLYTIREKKFCFEVKVKCIDTF